MATRRSSAARAPFIAVVVLILAFGLLGLLLLNTVLAQDAFRLHTLQLQGHVLADSEQSLQREVELLQSPASLASRAGALGMVPGGPPAFLRLSDGKVIGTALPGQAPLPVVAAPVAAPSKVAKPTAQPKPVGPGAGTWVPVPPAGKPATHPASKPGPRPTTKPTGQTTGARP